MMLHTAKKGVRRVLVKRSYLIYSAHVTNHDSVVNAYKKVEKKILSVKVKTHYKLR